MIKRGFIYYFKNLKYVFTVIGTLALGAAFGLAALLPGISNAINKMLTAISETLNYFDFDQNGVKSSIFSSISALDWSNPAEALKTAMSTEWLTGTVTNCAQEAFPNAAECMAKIEEAATACVNEIVFYATVFFSYVVLGLVAGYILVRWLIRRNMARRAFWKMFINYFMNALFNAAIIAFGVWLNSVWKGWAIVPILMIITLYGIVVLIEAYVIHGFKKIEFKRVLNIRNLLQLLIADILILLLSVGLAFAFIYITNALVGIMLGIAFIEIALVVVSLIAEAYVKETVKKGTENVVLNKG